MIDLRSDTVTRPDAEMRRAMAEAEVGDDVWGEDPTVQILEAEGAAAMGQERALFVPSGTMGNQIALHLHGRPGHEVICEANSHIYVFELGALAAITGLLPRLVPSSGSNGSNEGRLDPAAVEAAYHPPHGFTTPSGVLVVENTHNLAGGVVTDRPRLEALLAVARKLGLPVHLDGARIWNAAVALGTTPAALANGFDSVMFCLSKGLGAPVGSLLAGESRFIQEARRVRKMLGGGMRQVGVLAAAGLVALRKGPARLAEDHAHARRLAEALAERGDVEIHLDAVETNIVIFRVQGAAEATIAKLKEGGVLASQMGADRVRLVTHRDVGEEEIERAVGAIRGMESPRGAR